MKGRGMGWCFMRDFGVQKGWERTKLHRDIGYLVLIHKGIKGIGAYGYHACIVDLPIFLGIPSFPFLPSPPAYRNGERVTIQISQHIDYLSNMRQSGVLAKYSACETAQVRFVRFSTFTKEELESWSVAEITETRLYEGMKPVRGGPNDLRLGVSTLDQKCETCGQTRQCQGHFGHIKLNEPVFHYGFMQYVEKILKCICHNCSKLKIFQNDQQRQKFRRIIHIAQPTKRLNELAKLLAPINKCPFQQQEEEEEDVRNKGCGSTIPTRISLKSHRIIIEEKIVGEDGSKKKETVYTAQRVRNIFQKISPADSKLLGFQVTKPLDLLISTLAVAPPQIRPSIQMNPEKRAQDDITAAYVRIVSINNQLKGHIESSERSNKIAEMEKIIASIMVKVDRVNLQKPGGKKKKTLKAIKSIEERLKSKEGRFRQHLMGKRVDFSARSVVSPDSNLALDQLGVPQKIARSLTIPEQVTETNYDRMVKLCLQGKVKYILKPSQDKKKYDDIINFVKVHDKANEIQKYLNYGMIVERNLQNGDYVLFNRQPTLHRMSMMGHRVRILPYNTFRLNLSVCTPYNADFDGDQMNMHVPQSYETISQLKHITHVPKQIVAPKNNAPVMGIVQDALLGIYLFTMRDTFLTREEVMNLVIWIDSKQGKGQGNYQLQPGELPMPAILKPEPLWTGKQIMSMIIPEKITIQIWKSKDGLRNRDDSSMIIRKGELLSGALQKEVVGSGAGGLVHSIWLDIGPDATNQFVTIAQRIVNNWLMTNSFTVGAADCVPDEDLQRDIANQVQDINKDYYKILNKYRDEEKIISQNLHQRGKRVIDSFEYYINVTLNNRLSTMQKIVSEKVSPYLNCIYKMITAKSKGSETNLTQIMFCLGNQNVDGRRCPLGFARRALPHFSKDDNSPQSRGFVFSSFYKGLKPHEFFFHSMGGREGLSDTAVKTSRTGYIQRKLVKSLEDIVIQYDGTVRDSQNNLLQKLYGEDSFSAEYIEKHKISDVELSEEAFRAKYSWDRKALQARWRMDETKAKRLADEVQVLNKCRIRLREIFVIGKDSSDVEYYCPIKIERLINKIKAMTRERNPEIVSPLFVFENVQRLINECLLPQSAAEYQQILQRYAGVEKESKKNEFFKKKREFQQENGLELFRIHLRMFLCSKAICDNYRISQKCFLGLLQEIKTKFNQSLAPAGEAIGSVAAQSIGEPTTQMTLNTFHLAGVSDKNVTLGVPRLQELLDASKNIKTPNTTIFYYKPILNSARNTEQVTKILASVISFDFPERHVKDFLQASRIYYDANPEQSSIGAPSQQLLKQQRRTPWVISLVFDKKKLTSKQPWNQICTNIDKIFEENFEISEKVGFGQEKSPQIMLRCYEKVLDLLPKDSKDDATIFKFLNLAQAQIGKIFVSGIRGIKTVKTSKRVIFAGDSKEQLSKKKKDLYEFIVFQAEGTNLREILSHPKIDPYRSYSNDITEIFNVLGIQAARSAFINQFKQILKPYSIYVNHRHLSVLADWMSTRGVLTAINRNGINRVRDVSILRKASFEETTDILFGAAVFSQVDLLKGVSERIIFGAPVKIGTRSFEVMIDRDNVKNYNVKGKKDREHELEERQELNLHGEMPIGGRTPLGMETPIVKIGGTSIHNPAGKSSYYGGGGTSPGFMTPAYWPASERGFSQHNRFEELPASSPLSKTPILVNASNTPLLGLGGGLSTMSPLYTPLGMAGSASFHGNSAYQRGVSSNVRSPSYLYQGSGSSSPNYSSLHSHSPNYNSPLGSNGSQRYANSPNYSPSPMDRNQMFKDEENDSEEDDE